MSKEAIESSIGWYEVALLACALLVALGVVGEFVLGFMHWRLTTQLQAIQKQELTAMKASAADANARAATANEKVAQLNLRTEELRRDNLELEATFSPRFIKNTPTAVNGVSGYGSVKAIIEYVPDVECERTAKQIYWVLKSAEWDVSPARAIPAERWFFDGVKVLCRSAGVVPADVKRAKEASEKLIEMLNANGIKTTVFAADLNFAEGVVVIRVGMRPNPAAERMQREWDEKHGFPPAPREGQGPK